MTKSEIVAKLIEKGITISTAESMTGGLMAKLITDEPGTSAVFDRGLVTYSYKAKETELGVDPKIIEAYGAISSQVAFAMAEGLFEASKSDICISVTGNAGPHPAEDKPVGLYYVGLKYKTKTEIFEFQSALTGRNEIRDEACKNMFKLIEKAAL